MTESFQFYVHAVRGSYNGAEEIGQALVSFAELNALSMRFLQSLRETDYLMLDFDGTPAQAIAVKMIISGLYISEDKLPRPPKEMIFLDVHRFDYDDFIKAKF